MSQREFKRKLQELDYAEVLTDVQTRALIINCAKASASQEAFEILLRNLNLYKVFLAERKFFDYVFVQLGEITQLAYAEAKLTNVPYNCGERFGLRSTITTASTQDQTSDPANVSNPTVEPTLSGPSRKKKKKAKSKSETALTQETSSDTVMLEPNPGGTSVVTQDATTTGVVTAIVSDAPVEFSGEQITAQPPVIDVDFVAPTSPVATPSSGQQAPLDVGQSFQTRDNELTLTETVEPESRVSASTMSKRRTYAAVAQSKTSAPAKRSENPRPTSSRSVVPVSWKQPKDNSSGSVQCKPGTKAMPAAPHGPGAQAPIAKPSAGKGSRLHPQCYLGGFRPPRPRREHIWVDHNGFKYLVTPLHHLGIDQINRRSNNPGYSSTTVW